MNAIIKVRQFFGDYFFRKDLAKVKRNRCIKNLDDAETIGLVYDASEESSHVIVSAFMQFFIDHKKNVKALGYADFRTLPHYCFPKLSYNYFNRKDLNWYMKPTHPRVHDFINEEFDIVIDLCMQDCFPMAYVLGLSKAKFKVGRFSEKNAKIYDFMLNVDNSISIENYIKEITHYLQLINKNNDAK